MRITLEIDENGDHIFNIPPALIEAGLFLEDDEVKISAIKGIIKIENLSCVQMRVSRFRRNLNRILKNIENDLHPLNRVLVHSRYQSFWVIPYEYQKQRRYFQPVAPDKGN